MPLSTTFRRHITNPRKIVSVSVSAGLAVSILFIIITLMLVWQRRNEQHDRLVSDTQSYILNVFDSLTDKLSPLDAFTYDSCDTVKASLTQQAAFARNTRTILLVDNQVAFCSSATGNIRQNIAALFPEIDLRKAMDIQLTAETPGVPDRPAMILWRQNPSIPGSGVLTLLDINLTPYLLLTAHQKGISGMAIITGKQAITLKDERVTQASLLPEQPLRTVSLPGYPIRMMLYGTTLSADDVLIVVLGGILLALLSGGACGLLLTLRLRPGKEILQGIRRGEFHVEYQPIVNTATGKTCEIEALLRWTHPTAGRIPPDSFIRYAEGQNQIAPLTRHLFELVARDAHKLRHKLPKGIAIGLNISPSHLVDEAFCQDVRRWLAAMPEDHFRYVFEITERTMVSEHNAARIFDWIRAQNICIAIDDFGTGHSALIYLEKFNFDCLKIDRGFVQSIGRETVTSPVLDTVITLAKKLGLKTIAEGVEEKEQAQWLIERGVTHLQGYLFSHPLTVLQLTDYFQQTAVAQAGSDKRQECLEA